MDERANNDNSANQDQQPAPAGRVGSPVSENIGEQDQPGNHDAGSGDKNGGNKNWIQRLWSEGPDRQLELIFAFVIAFSSVAQIIVTVINDRSTSAQVDRIIFAANGIKDASTQIQQAAYNFSGAAVGINNAGWNAFGQLKLQEQQMEAARTATDADARRSLDTTIDNFHGDQRAWVGVLGVDSGDFSKTNGFPVTITFSNSGRTPARHVTFSERYFYTPIPVAGPPDDEVRKLVPFSGSDIAPQGKLIRKLQQAAVPTHTFTTEQLQGNNDVISHFDAINEGAFTLYYFGTLTYDDIFGKTHTTDFCIYIIDPKAKMTGTCDAFNDIQ